MAKKAKNKLVHTVGKNIQMRRKALGLTQQQLADRLGVAFETISRYERAALAPSFAQLERLEDVLKVSADVLLASEPQTPDKLIMHICSQLPENTRAYILASVRNYVRYHGQEQTSAV
jgi:transcriptional regulator with XRE-family HTH domain